jgi:hypothetical protein
MYDDFNPDSTVRLLPTIKILKKNGDLIDCTNRIIRLDSQGSIELDADIALASITLNTAQTSNLYYVQKYLALKNMIEGGNISGPYLDVETNVTPEGDAWTFTDAVLYYTKIASTPPEDLLGVSFLTTDSCSNYIQGENLLTLLDICGPCIDCPTYETFQTYLDRIDEMIQYIWKLTGDTITNTIPVAPDGAPLENFSGIYVQALTALNYWNYLVHKQSVKASAQSFGQSISAAAYYRNISPSSVGPITINVKFTFLRKSGMSYFTWNGIAPGNTEVRVVSRENATNAPLLSGPAFTGNTVEVDLDAGSLASGDEIFGDVVLMITNTSLFNDSPDQILIQVTTTFSVTHIGSNITLTNIVYFRPPDGSSGSA